MRAGPKRSLATVENPTRSPDGYGSYTETYAPASPSTLWLQLRPMDGAERQRAGVVDTTVTHVISSRYHAGVTTQTRLTVDTPARTLVVKAVRNLDDRETEIEMLAAEVAAVTLPAPKGQYAARVLVDGASHYWRLNETSGSVAWDLAGGLGGTIQGGVTRGVPGPLADGSTAMTFDGTTAKMSTPLLPPIPIPYTVELWMRTTVGMTQQEIVVTTTAYPQFQMYSYPYGAPGWLWIYHNQTTSDQLVANTTTPINDGLWHHLVVVITATAGFAVYRDGVSIPVSYHLPIPTLTAPLAQSWYFGAGPFGLPWPGTLDEVALYPRALTAQEVADHYALRTAP